MRSTPIPVPPTPANTANSLGITNDQLRTGVQAVSPVQMNAQKQMSVEASKMNLVGSRLLDLRGGARGFVVGLNGQETQPTGAADAQARSLAGATGGGAAADDAMGGSGAASSISATAGAMSIRRPCRMATSTAASTCSSVRTTVSAIPFVLGGAISYSDTHSDYDQSLGNVKAATTGVAGYGTYYVDDWYVDGFVAYGYVDYDSTRNIFIPSNSHRSLRSTRRRRPSRRATNGRRRSAWVVTSTRATIIITPTARLGYIWVKNKAFSENEPINGLGLAVDSRTIRSLQSALGGKAEHEREHLGGGIRPVLYRVLDA